LVIEAILPAAVATAEAWDDAEPAPLHPDEAGLVSGAVEARQREFATGRACARRALAQLGVEATAIGGGERGEPLWPRGVVGSITHCRGYRGAAAARGGQLASLGIDAEPHEPLPPGLLGDVAGATERRALAELAAGEPGIHWDRLLFSAKESVYKAWFPLARRWLGFEDAELDLDRERRIFSARLLVPGPRLGGSELRRLDGRWLAADGLIFTAVTVPAAA
ncbi:MAG: 4'-phosphopantetheinyl transferase family protein, partial [Solirubrobacterales bacterium]